MDELQKIIKHYDTKKNSCESDIVKIGSFKFLNIIFAILWIMR